MNTFTFNVTDIRLAKQIMHLIETFEKSNVNSSQDSVNINNKEDKRVPPKPPVKSSIVEEKRIPPKPPVKMPQDSVNAIDIKEEKRIPPKPPVKPVKVSRDSVNINNMEDKRIPPKPPVKPVEMSQDSVEEDYIPMEKNDFIKTICMYVKHKNLVDSVLREFNYKNINNVDKKHYSKICAILKTKTI